MCPESANEDKPSYNYPPAKNPDKTGKGETTSSVGWPSIGQFRTHPSKARQTRHILLAASHEGSCAGTAAVPKTQLSVSPGSLRPLQQVPQNGML